MSIASFTGRFNSKICIKVIVFVELYYFAKGNERIYEYELLYDLLTADNIWLYFFQWNVHQTYTTPNPIQSIEMFLGDAQFNMHTNFTEMH